MFGGDGLPLGVTGEETYDEVHEFTMEPGDVLVLLTDGFVEWSRPSDNELFGTTRLTSVVREHARESAKVVMEALDRAVRDFSQGSRQADDMTAVIIKRT